MKINDLVKLKSGGPEMKIIGIGNDDNFICEWVGDNAPIINFAHFGKHILTNEYLKIFEINSGESEWVLAYTNIHALKVLQQMNGITLEERDDYEYVLEISEEAAKLIPWHDDEYSKEENKDLNLFKYIKTNPEHFSKPTYLGASCW